MNSKMMLGIREGDFYRPATENPYFSQIAITRPFLNGDRRNRTDLKAAC
jgi:hypothetical protein